MNGEAPSPVRNSDVWTMLRDTRIDVLDAVEKVDAKVTQVASRVEIIERDRLVEHTTELTQRRLLGMAKGAIISIVALIVSSLSGIAALIAVFLSQHKP